MVKRGGTRRKIPMEKITKKESLATAFTKRSYGVFSKASQLCLLYGAQIAVLATPPTSQSKASFYSFGHSSVYAVVSAFLNGQQPVSVPEETMKEDLGVCLARKSLGLGMWWEDERLARLENPQELMDAEPCLLCYRKGICLRFALSSYNPRHGTGWTRSIPWRGF